MDVVKQPYLSPREHPHRLLDMISFGDPATLVERVEQGEIPKADVIAELDWLLTHVENQEAKGKLTKYQADQEVQTIKAVLDRLSALD